jgi:tripartite-type tricarboxylate transporter receptor subunit TctC
MKTALPLRLVITAIGALTLGGLAHAQDNFPGKPVRIIVPYAPGGVADAQARILAQRLQARWGQTVTVENRPGGNTVVGTNVAAKAPADCSTLFLGTLATILNDLFYDKLPYDRKADLAEVSLTTKVPNVLVVGPESKFKTVAELIAYGRANPGKLTYASTGQGGSSHLSAELLAAQTGIKMVHAPFSGGAAAQRELIPGRVDFLFDSSSYPAVMGGRLRALAVGTPTRSKLIPEVPTLSEAGLKQFNSATWFGFYTPKANGQAPACLPRLAKDIAEETQATEVRARFYTFGADAVGSTPQEMVRWQDEELRRWSTVIKQANITIAK